MKILHTSDWHLGQVFKGRSREEEHQKFLDWLVNILKEEKIETLIIAGDIFDSYNPPNYSLKMYHKFLAKLIDLKMNVFIIAGNHDSISTLEVSKDILKSLNIHIVTTGENINDIIFEFEDIVICAVPFLRERVIKTTSLTLSKAEEELNEGIKNYYHEVYNRAKKFNKKIIVTGHLSVSGALFSESEREVYIGKIKTIDKNIFKKFDYVALGHIHKPQKIADNIYYSGSPIPLSFSEKEDKRVLIIDEEIKEKKIPTFRKLIELKGTFEEVKKEISKIEDKNPFVKIELNENVSSNQLDELRIDNIDIVEIKQKYISSAILEEDIDIEKLTPFNVFEERLKLEDLSEEEKEKLTNIYEEIIKGIKNED